MRRRGPCCRLGSGVEVCSCASPGDVSVHALCAPRVRRRRPKSVDLLGDELGVILDPAEQRRAPGVLPAQSQEVEAGRLGHAAPVLQVPVSVEHGCVDERVIDPEPGRPHDRAHVELCAVGEAHR